ncbi:MAG: DegQ family serine endoprotease [Pseudomonadota bacterium]|nr:DegQ family serine endoprotease [Pseudomonadota bacterium]
MNTPTPRRLTGAAHAKTFRFSPARLVVALAAAGVIGGAGASLIEARHAVAAAPVATMTTAAPYATVTAPDFSAIAAQEGKAVVNISVTGMHKMSNQSQQGMPPGMQGMDPHDPFFQFYRRFQGQQGQHGQQGGMPENVPMRGQGSGFIVSADGLILTNAHVVHDATEVLVKLTDRREFVAKVLGADEKTDVAVLKIDATNLPVVRIGDSHNLKVGQWVLAIGSPFGFENTVTAGVVSAKGRSLPDDSFVPFIQTDVAVNPGNSGGPLINANGEVVGINSQIFSRSGGYQGLSFAIPIDVAQKVRSQIVATGSASHAKLGVSVQEVNQVLADSFKLPKPEGALVASVEPDSPAAKAGLKTGDVIQSVNGHEIVSSGDLPAVIGLATPGDKVTLEVWRQGGHESLDATLGNASDKSEQVAGNDATPGNGKLGLALRPLQPEERQQSGIENGLVVQQASGPAGRAGVQEGDVLLAINGKPVNNLAQVRQAVAKADKSVALLIERDGNKIFVPVRLG